MRTMIRILTVAVLCGVPLAAATLDIQSTTNNTGLVLEVMARRTGSAAGDFDASQFQSFIYASSANSCGLGAGDNAPADIPVAGWHVNGKVLGTTKGAAGDQLVVTIDWERRWENGAATTQGPRGSTKLTMSAGDTIVLDRIAQTAAGNCPNGDLRLVTSVVGRSEALRPESMLSIAGRGFAGRGAGAGMATAGGGGMRGVTGDMTATRPSAAGGAGGRGVAGVTGDMTATRPGATGAAGARGGRGAAGDATVAATAAGAGTGAGRGGGRGANATAATTMSGSTTSGSGRGTTGNLTTTRGGRGGPGGGGTFGPGYTPQAWTVRGAQYTSELWLVHKQPNGEEHVQQLSIQFGPAGTEFSFPPASVNTSRGVVTVDITGRLQMNARPGELATDARSLYGQFLMQQRATTTQRPGSAASSAYTAANPATNTAATDTSKIQVSISRRARSSAAALDTSGGSSMAIELPKAEEVVSFEFPPLQKATEDLLAGHKFSLRLRVSPVK